MCKEPSISETSHPSLLKRKIIHFDMDCFFAAVEIRDNPSLKGKPVIVGGQPESRGVVATCSYEARKFGIHSAMSCAKAYKLCPDAIFVKPHFEKYKTVSSQIRDIFKQYTDLVEPLSLDEAFLDVTAHKLFATEIAKRVRAQIFSETGLTCSAGVGANKLIAKIASDMNKPDGLTVIRPNQSKPFMGSLTLRKIPGVGKVTNQKLQKLGFNLCSDIWPFTQIELENKLGKRMADWLYSRSRGIDERPVKTEWIRKSLSAENTFSTDIKDIEKIKEEILTISQRVSDLLIKKELSGKTLTLKVKYSDFKQITRSITLETATHDASVIYDTSCDLLLKTEVGRQAVRLIGIGLSSFGQKENAAPLVTHNQDVQLSLPGGLEQKH